LGRALFALRTVLPAIIPQTREIFRRIEHLVTKYANSNGTQHALLKYWRDLQIAYSDEPAEKLWFSKPRTRWPYRENPNFFGFTEKLKTRTIDKNTKTMKDS
jgi:hypothetical protein